MKSCHVKYVTLVRHTVFLTQCWSHDVGHTMFFTLCSSHNLCHTMFISQCLSHSVPHTFLTRVNNLHKCEYLRKYKLKTVEIFRNLYYIFFLILGEEGRSPSIVGAKPTSHLQDLERGARRALKL